jgi:hypothetical protein
MKIRRKIVRNEEYEQRTQLTGGDVLILAGIIQAQFCELPLFHYSEGANKCITAEIHQQEQVIDLRKGRGSPCKGQGRRPSSSSRNNHSAMGVVDGVATRGHGPVTSADQVRKSGMLRRIEIDQNDSLKEEIDPDGDRDLVNGG